ncbi:hypothetical protein CRG98_006594 [Punica granatum]|uniref:Uncharacterized protein n=1 Tax=Punica granatum TaxID=22663 RepID=A0A2I0KX38_PUNGR|nr:hypothetical protein CRG98_006594 [Punica granatum]
MVGVDVHLQKQNCLTIGTGTEPGGQRIYRRSRIVLLDGISVDGEGVFSAIHVAQDDRSSGENLFDDEGAVVFAKDTSFILGHIVCAREIDLCRYRVLGVVCDDRGGDSIPGDDVASKKAGDGLCGD